MLIKKKLKIIFFTNNIRALNIIEKILNKKFLKIELVVTTKKITPKLLFKKIKLYKIKKLFFENNENSIYRHVKNIKPDFIICSGFTKLIPFKILNLANYCSINLHGGRVPSYLGASTLNWQIINGEKEIYISALKMNEKYDDGPLISQKKININNNDNIDKIKVKVNKYFPELFFKALKHILLKKKLIYFKKYKKKYWKQRNKKNRRRNYY